MLLFGFRRGITLRSPGGSCCRFAAGRGCVGALADEPRRTARFSAPFPFVLPRACRELLSAFGSGNRTNFLQNDDIRLFFLFLHRTDNKKGTSEKGSFVRDKGASALNEPICISVVCVGFSTSFPRIAYRFFAWVCTGLRVLPLLQPYLLVRQYKDTHFRRKIQMREIFGDAGRFFYICSYG